MPWRWRTAWASAWQGGAPRAQGQPAPALPLPLTTRLHTHTRTHSPHLVSLRSTAYKLNVHENRRVFDESGWDIVSHFKPLRLPYYYTEVQTRRAMRFAYKVTKDLIPQLYEPMFDGEIIELLFTREEWEEPVVHNTEKVPFTPEP